MATGYALRVAAPLRNRASLASPVGAVAVTVLLAALAGCAGESCPSEAPQAPRRAGIEDFVVALRGSPFATDADYERVASDFERIEAKLTKLAGFIDQCHQDGTSIGLALDSTEAATEFADEQSCFLSRFEASAETSPFGGAWVGVSTLQNVNMLYFLERASQLPHVVEAQPAGHLGDRPYYCGNLDEAYPHHYVFRSNSGDCSSGCIEETFDLVAVEANGDVNVLAEWWHRNFPPDDLPTVYCPGGLEGPVEYGHWD